MIRRLLQRPFCTRTGSHGVLKPQDNAPRQSQNEEWLNSLDQAKPSSLITSILKDKDSYFEPFRSDNKFQRTSYKVLSRLSKNKVRISIPINNFYLKSSPFSHLPSKQRPKADSRVGFSDVRVIKLRSGKGGDGCVSFFRDSGNSVGPPDGGDGGDGGSVYVQALDGVASLSKIKQSYIAGEGHNGQAKQLDGAAGRDVLLTVPVGTVIRYIPEFEQIKQYLKEGKMDAEIEVEARTGALYDNEPGLIQLRRDSYKTGKGWIFKDKDEEWHNERDFFRQLNNKVKKYDNSVFLDEFNDDLFPLHGMDLTRPSRSPTLILKGGKGGLGNMHFLTDHIRNPRFSKMGRAGFEGYFLFELKLLADLGLVGLPNAGKSTLLRAISNARPRVGHWEFTTLHPTIGTIFTGIDKKPFTVADIPGLIEGASENKGLGMDFLRHVERSGGLVFVISLGSKNPIGDFEILLKEMGYRIENKNILVVATKADVQHSRENYNLLRSYVEGKGWKIVPVCAKNKENIEKCILMMDECAKNRK